MVDSIGPLKGGIDAVWEKKALTAQTAHPQWLCPLMIYFSVDVFTKGYNWCAEILIRDIL